MTLIKRKEFIENFKTMIGHKLENSLPEEDFEFEMINQTLKIIEEELSHIKSGM